MKANNAFIHTVHHKPSAKNEVKKNIGNWQESPKSKERVFVIYIRNTKEQVL